MDKIVIYCHGFGKNKERIDDHYELLEEYGIGMIGFDFPHHREDKTVLLDNVRSFVKSNKLKINIVVGEIHEMPNHLYLINNELIRLLNN